MKTDTICFFLLLACSLSARAQVSSGLAQNHIEETAARFVTSSDGTLIAVHESGPKQGPPIIFVHGWSANSDVWVQQQSSPLLRQYHIVAMDLRGHGFSGKPSDPKAYADPNLFADDINAVIQQLQLDRPALIGWSLGGGIVMEYLQKFGDSMISGVDLVDTLASPNAMISQQAVMQIAQNPFIPLLINSDASTNFTGVVKYVNFFASASPTDSGPLTAGEESMLQEIMQSTPVFVRNNYVNGVGAAILTNFGSVLSALTVPVLLQGAHNDAVFPQDLLIPAEAVIIKVPTERFYPIGGHIPFLLFPDQFNRDLAAWLATLRF